MIGLQQQSFNKITPKRKNKKSILKILINKINSLVNKIRTIYHINISILFFFFLHFSILEYSIDNIL